jgi:hypothetical protein
VLVRLEEEEEEDLGLGSIVVIEEEEVFPSEALRQVVRLVVEKEQGK